MANVLPSNEITQTALSQSVINPFLAQRMLEEGNKRFMNNESINRDLHAQIKDTATGQYPFAAIVSCIDSRIHTSCGAVKGACDHAKLGNLTQMLDKIMPAVNAVQTPPNEDRSSANLDFVNKVAQKNVALTIENIKTQSDVLNEMHRNGAINIVGAMYDVKTGVVTFYSDETT